jgi:hypothetical protein
MPLGSPASPSSAGSSTGADGLGSAFFHVGAGPIAQIATPGRATGVGLFDAEYCSHTSIVRLQLATPAHAGEAGLQLPQDEQFLVGGPVGRLGDLLRIRKRHGTFVK